MPQKVGLNFGELMQYQRRMLGLTQKELGEQSGKSATYIARIERGETTPHNDVVLKKMAQVLGIMENEFLQTAKIDWISITNLNQMFPNILQLLMRALACMTPTEINTIIRPLEKAIPLFSEPNNLLALNFANYLLGNLPVDAKPENGLRPISHYLNPFRPEVLNQEANVDKTIENNRKQDKFIMKWYSNITNKKHEK